MQKMLPFLLNFLKHISEINRILQTFIIYETANVFIFI